MFTINVTWPGDLEIPGKLESHVIAHIDNRDGGNRSLTEDALSGDGLKLTASAELTDEYKKSLALGLMLALVDRELSPELIKRLYDRFVENMDTPYWLNGRLVSPYSPGPGVEVV